MQTIFLKYYTYIHTTTTYDIDKPENYFSLIRFFKIITDNSINVHTRVI